LVHPKKPWFQEIQMEPLDNEQLSSQISKPAKGKNYRSARRNKNIKGRNMKLSVEAKVAAAVAAGFMVMSSGAMAQGHKGQTAGPNHYGPTNNPGVNTHMNQQGDNSSLVGRTNAEENKATVSDEKVTSSGREQRVDRRENREQRVDRRENREQRVDRRENREQRQDRHQGKSTKDKSPFDGSILDVKPST
jgi:hypothetical protein